MKVNKNRKKELQLGMSLGKARAILFKKIVFNLLKVNGINFCYQCSNEIENINELSIEHKIPWLNIDDPFGLFMNLDNIAFSHLSCNVKAKKFKIKHGKAGYGERKCRCEICTKANTDAVTLYRERKKLK